jgi:hypothetical protein
MKPIKLKKGDKVVCTHYKDRPVCIVTDVNAEEIWVKEMGWMVDWWYGPRNWFRKLPRKKK